MANDGGIGRLKQRLAAIPKNVKAAVQPALQKQADAMADTMRRLAPDDPATDAPDLKSSIAVTPSGQQTPPYSQPGGSMTVPENAFAVTAGMPGSIAGRCSRTMSPSFAPSTVRGWNMPMRRWVPPPRERRAAPRIRRSIPPPSTRYSDELQEAPEAAILQASAWMEAGLGRASPWLKKPVSLLDIKPAPIFTGARRKSAVSAAMDVLRDWRLSPFEHEAATLSGLRSGLCLQGYDFARADAEASAIVAEGLRLLGVARPTWDQGQREYVEPRENCAWCSMPMDPFRRSARYCSPHCAKMGLMTRGYEGLSRENNARQRALRIARKLTRNERICAHCGTGFFPEFESSPTRFCSRSCAYEHQHSTAAATIERNCAVCGAAFMANLKRAMYCSSACQLTASRRRRGIQPKGLLLSKICQCCGAPFETTSRNAIYCSTVCVRLVNRFATGNGIPKKVTPLVFDYITRIAA